MAARGEWVLFSAARTAGDLRNAAERGSGGGQKRTQAPPQPGNLPRSVQIFWVTIQKFWIIIQKFWELSSMYRTSITYTEQQKPNVYYTCRGAKTKRLREASAHRGTACAGWRSAAATRS
eukprot:5846703-Pyramimonas_sp.AAC.1